MRRARGLNTFVKRALFIGGGVGLVFYIFPKLTQKRQVFYINANGKSKTKESGFPKSSEKPARPSNTSSTISMEEEEIKEFEFLTWPTEYVSKALAERGLLEAANRFMDKRKLTEELLDILTEETLKDLNIEDSEKRKYILKSIRGISEETNRKVFNDSVHGHLEIHPLCVNIIDTPEFQRLRYIKQTGCTYFVYPGAGHNRFEHSLGVCHLASKLLRALRIHQPELNITNKDILCVEIAGLCHDLGHGPFSHLFDLRFIPTARPDIKWKHEEASVMMFDHMLKNNESLRKEFKKYGLTDQDIQFIKEQILGPSKNGENKKYHGRDEKKAFLYEIVANKKNGIDVDKWDYLARDCYGLGIRNSFDHGRFMIFARVVKADNGLQICTRDKEAETVYGMFQLRSILHRRAFQHRVCNVISIMITDALIEADKVAAIVPRQDGTFVKMADSIYMPDAYINLNDTVCNVILSSTNPELEKARQILQRVERRHLYRCVGFTTPKKGYELVGVSRAEQSINIRDEIMTIIGEKSGDILTKDDLVVDIVYLDYGFERKNPMDDVKFYRKNDLGRAVRLSQDDVSLMLPGVFAEEIIRLYCKKDDDKAFEIAKEGFQRFCVRHRMETQEDLRGHDAKQ